MSEQQRVLDDFRAAGVLAAMRWAYLSATERSLQLYREDEGLDPAWLGITRFTYLRDRLDRVFGCGRHAPGGPDSDVRHAALSRRDIDTMPRPAPGPITRSDLCGSPGWQYGERRFLLASCDFGRIDLLPWPRKSATKQRVARQHSPEPAQPSLFEDLAVEEVGGLAAVLAGGEDLNTFVLAHSLDPHGRRGELVLGRPRLNVGGGQAWHWRQDILDGAALDGTGPAAEFTPHTRPDAVPDAPVRLRPSAKRRHAGGA
jgi:hypothetical protein